MKLEIEPTKEWLRTPEGALCRVWRITDGSALLMIAAVATPTGEATNDFERELIEVMTLDTAPAPKPGGVLQ